MQSEIFLGLGVLVTLAAMGVSTLVAFGLMALMGFVTEMSFRRIFFLSFGMTLLPSVLLGAILIGVLQDDDVQTEIRAELGDAIPESRALPVNLQDRLQQLEGLRDGDREGNLDTEDIERIIEESIPGSDVQIDDDGVRITTDDESVNIQIN